MPHTIKISIKMRTATELPKRVSIATSSIKELNVLINISAWISSIDAILRVVNYKFNSESNRSFNDPYTLKILFWIAIGIS